ncbi:MAG: LCP family protein [Anaerovoracaceae bacterium]|jgi:LCP family protein required for cell wall assembly
MKVFIKHFLIWLVIFIVILTPVSYALDQLGAVRVFQGTESLKEELDLNVLIDPKSPFFEAFRDSKRVNALLLGVNDELTDTIMLVSYDMKNQRVDVISVPRDTYYERKEATTAGSLKINAIYRKGTAVGTAKAVSDVLMGIPIHYYAVVTYDGIGRIVDSIGGVPMDIPFHMYYKDPTDTPPLYIDIPKGPIVIDSRNVEQFLRFRKGSPGYPGYPDGDIGRIKAQQEFVKSAFRQALGLQLPKVAKTVIENVDSDLPLSMALKIVAKATGLKGENIQTWLTPGKAGMKNGASYWWVDKEAVEEMLMEIYSIETEEPQSEEQDEVE